MAELMTVAVLAIAVVYVVGLIVSQLIFKFMEL